METARQTLDRIANASMQVRAKNEIAGKLKVLSRAEMFDPRLSRIYFSEISELPDAVKNHPVSAQRAFMMTFNNVLARTGDEGKAMRGAWRALRNKVSHLHELRRRALGMPRADSDLARWAAKRIVRGRQAQIVVP